MPTCPNCRAGVTSPSKTWLIPSEPDKEGKIVQRRVAIFECPQCGSKFPDVVGSQKLKIVDAEEWKELRGVEARLRVRTLNLGQELQALKDKNTQLEAEISHLREQTLLEGLQTRLESLQREVSTLRDRKKELEEELQARSSE